LKGTRNCIGVISEGLDKGRGNVGRIEEIGGEDRRRNDQLTNNVVNSEDRTQGFGGGEARRRA